MRRRKFGWLGRFIVIAVGVAALVAFMPLIGPIVANSPSTVKGFLSSAADVSTSSDGPASVADDSPATAAEAAEPVALSVPARPDSAAPMVVDYVHDGDTLFLVPADGSSGDRLKVRLIGLDTPEIGDNAECFGAEATETLRALLPEGSQVFAAADLEPTDKYGRSLFYLWTADGSFVNYELLAQGAAGTLSISPNIAYQDVFRAAEEAAQAAFVGLWGAC
ncbi:thermonuclease family protein [Leifsonia sp. A12D58]|uniref:thermonuclease family protein n=1 Tax=Leifsonia sp. A12D58 TaxID=3397674 RepID=UPI0039DFF003